jgi:choline dehydrogenase-like flavoprotein
MKKLTDKIYDICVIGSGAGAGPVIYELSKAGFSVICLEKGPWIKTNDFTKDEIVASRRDVYNSKQFDEPQMIEWKQMDGSFEPKSNKYGGLSFWNGNCVGGSSNFMSGYFHRNKPNDFKLLSTYGSIDGANIVDWPISYDDLEPFYDKVEKIVGISGQVQKHKQQEPRSSENFPFPPLETNIISHLIDKAANDLGIETIPIPRAILSKEKGHRKPCYYSNYCGSYGCSSDAKGSSRAALIDEAMETGLCEVIPFAKVYHLQTDGKGKIIRAHYHHKESTDEYIEAKIFVVAAQAIETSRLLLLSKNPEFPNGLANNNNQVGKNLLFSAGGIGSGIFEKENYESQIFEAILKPGVFVNRAIQYYYEIEDLEPKTKLKGGTIDFLWEHANPIRKANTQKWDKHGNILYGSELKKKIFSYFTEKRKLTFEVFNDWLPNDDCFVTLDEFENDIWGDKIARIRVNNHPHDIKIGKYLAQKGAEILKKMGANEIKFEVNGSPTPNLQAGGCRFGENPQQSVLNPNCKAHDVDNLYITDGSFMPTGGSSTFTWTIYANSFRVSEIIINHLKNINNEY